MYKKSEDEIMENWQGDKSHPIVSVCSITYNHEEYIAEAIDSFLMQETNFPFEIIVHDDASTDSTREILLKYSERYPNIVKLILQEENQFSKGKRILPFVLKKAIGKYAAICEGDDYWTDPLKLQYQFDLMEKHPDCHMSFHPAIELVDGKITEKIICNYSDENKIFNVSRVISGGGGFCPSASIMVNNTVVDHLPSFFYKVPVGDYFLQVLASLKGGALYINKAMSVYRKGHENSWSVGVRSVEKQLEVANKLLNSMEELNKYTGEKYSRAIMHEMSRLFYFPSLQSTQENNFKQLRNILLKYNLKYRRWDIINYFIIVCFYIKWGSRVSIKLLTLFFFKNNKMSPVMESDDVL